MSWGESIKLECKNKHEDIESLVKNLLKYGNSRLVALL